MATMERIPLPEPCREQDELYQTHGAIPGGKSLCSAGRENPGPCRRSQPLHRSCNTRHCARRVSLSRESGSALTPHFVQQSRNLDLSQVRTTLRARLCHCPFRQGGFSSRVLIDIVPDFKCSLCNRRVPSQPNLTPRFHRPAPNQLGLDMFSLPSVPDLTVQG